MTARGRAEPVGQALAERGRRVADYGGELVAAHAGQRVIGPEALCKDVRDGLDQPLRGSRAVPLDHIAVPVHVDGQKRQVLGVFPGAVQFGLEPPPVPQAGQRVAVARIERRGAG